MDKDIRVEYESFPFDPAIIDLVFESRKSEFVESENIMMKHFYLDQTLEHFDIKRLGDIEPTVLPRRHVRDVKIARPITKLLACYEYLYLLYDWAQQFD